MAADEEKAKKTESNGPIKVITSIFYNFFYFLINIVMFVLCFALAFNYVILMQCDVVSVTLKIFWQMIFLSDKILFWVLLGTQSLSLSHFFRYLFCFPPLKGDIFSPKIMIFWTTTFSLEIILATLGKTVVVMSAEVLSDFALSDDFMNNHTIFV